ncbi:MAG: hypothetical protein K2J82_06255 [Muribaculaceae bacterium]|nr:hypothetical protein [Muribaculaceae bacterium]MDE6754195.1 hypothetical protein [Muribaculaceae bacterium]
MTNNIIEELSFRKEEDYDLRFEKRTVIASDSGFEIVERNGWKGIKYNDKVLIPTIYDDVQILRSKDYILGLTSLMGLKGLWKINFNQGCVIFEPKYHDIKISPYYNGVIIINQDKEGLFSIPQKEVLLDPVYQEVSLNLEAKNIWAKVDEQNWIFLNLLTKYKNIVRSRIIPIENTLFSGYILPSGQLYLLEGDSYSLRKLVVKNRGRLKLSNSRLYKDFIIDPNGFVLNL